MVGEEQRWAKTGLMVSAGAHALLGGVALFAGALFNAPDDEPIQIMQTAIVTEEEFAEIVGQEKDAAEPPKDVLALAEPPAAAEAAEPIEPDAAQDPDQLAEPADDAAKAPYQTAPPPPPQPQFRADRDVLPSDKIREALAKPDPKVFKDLEAPKPPQQDQVAEADFSDRIEQDPCVAAADLTKLCAADAGRCAAGSKLAGQLTQAKASCQAKEERLAEAEREKERLEEERKKQEEEKRLAEEKRLEEQREAEAKKAAAQKQAMRQALRSALADVKKRAAIQERREAEARKRREAALRKQAEAGADLIDDLLNLDAGQQPVQRDAARVAGTSQQLSSGEKASLAFNFKREWLAPDPDALDVRELVVELEVRLDSSGNVLGEPRTLSPVGTLTPRQITAIFNAKRAVQLGAPHQGPPDKYDRWRVIHITYDPVRREAIIN